MPLSLECGKQTVNAAQVNSNSTGTRAQVQSRLLALWEAVAVCTWKSQQLLSQHEELSPKVYKGSQV